MNTKSSETISAPPPPGSVVLFEQDSEPVLALVLGVKKDRLQLFSERARPVELPPNRVTEVGLRAQTGLTNADQQNYLQSLKNESLRIGNSIDLDELWRIVSEYPKAYDAEELAGLCFPTPSPEQRLAVRLLLLSDRSYFKRDKDQFIARPENIVEELKRARLQVLEKQRLRDMFGRLLTQSEPEIPPELNPLLTILKRYAVGAEISASEEREAKEIVQQAGGRNPAEAERVSPVAAYSILERLKIFGPRTNPAWERSGLPGVSRFEVGRLESELEDSADQNREDLTSLDIFTVDDISTRDMDDALSLETTTSGYRLGVHITDVASEIGKGTELDRETARRLSSIYLPERTIHMLPEALSIERLSLREAERRRAMTIFVEFDRSYEILKTSLTPSWVQVKRRWTYEQVDDLLENSNSEFSTFYEISSALEEARMQKGAMRVQKTEIGVMVDADGVVSLREIDEQSPARAMVAEMAVLVNRVVAEFCRDNRIPAIFRSQAESETDEEPAPEEGRARDHFIRVRLKRSEASLEARSHAGLGLSAYLQITSPIRRFVDLINQRQVMAKLSGGALPYPYSELEEQLPLIEQGLFKIQKLAKESKRFWLLRYLEQRIAKGGSTGRKIGAVVVRTSGRHPTVELDEVFFAALLKTAKKLAVGDKVEVTIGGIDARSDYLRLELD